MTTTTWNRLALRILTLFLRNSGIDNRREERDLVPDGTQFGPYGAVDFQSEENVQVALLKINLNGLWQVHDDWFRDTTHLTLKSNLLVLAVQLLV